MVLTFSILLQIGPVPALDLEMRFPVHQTVVLRQGGSGRMVGGVVHLALGHTNFLVFKI